MLKKKSIVGALAFALALGASGIASATLVTVDGVSWDTASPLDLQVQGLNLRETQISAVGDTLHGYGQVGGINGNTTTFCSGCNLTFSFTYNVSDITGNQITFNGGTINFFVSSPGTFAPGDPSSANLGTPWLTLAGHTGTFNTFPSGTLFATVNGTPADPTLGSTGQGFLDAIGGPAAMYMNTNTIDAGNGTFADFAIGSTFLTAPWGGCPALGAPVCAYQIAGTATIQGKSEIPVRVPEPGPIGLLGVGLAVLGLFMRRRRNEAEGRA